MSTVKTRKQIVCQVNDGEPTVIEGFINCSEHMSIEQQLTQKLAYLMQHTTHEEISIEITPIVQFIGRYGYGSRSLSQQSLTVFVKAICKDFDDIFVTTPSPIER